MHKNDCSHSGQEAVDSKIRPKQPADCHAESHLPNATPTRQLNVPPHRHQSQQRKQNDVVFVSSRNQQQAEDAEAQGQKDTIFRTAMNQQKQKSVGQSVTETNQRELTDYTLPRQELAQRTCVEGKRPVYLTKIGIWMVPTQDCGCSSQLVAPIGVSNKLKGARVPES